MPTVNGRKIYRTCGRCGGTGKLYLHAIGGASTVPFPGAQEMVCPTCNGVKLELFGWVKEDVESFSW